MTNLNKCGILPVTRGNPRREILREPILVNFPAIKARSLRIMMLVTVKEYFLYLLLSVVNLHPFGNIARIILKNLLEEPTHKQNHLVGW